MTPHPVGVAEVIDWMGMLVLGAALFVPLLLLGYGLAGFLLYWWSDERVLEYGGDQHGSTASSTGKGPVDRSRLETESVRRRAHC